MTTEIDKKLIAASKIGDLEEITKLITAGADIHAQDEHQLTPVHWLARNGFIDALEFVLKKIAQPLCLTKIITLLCIRQPMVINLLVY